MKNLYAQYGELMVQLEILNNRIAEVKTRIAEGLRNPPKEEANAEGK